MGSKIKGEDKKEKDKREKEKDNQKEKKQKQKKNEKTKRKERGMTIRAVCSGWSFFCVQIFLNTGEKAEKYEVTERKNRHIHCGNVNTLFLFSYEKEDKGMAMKKTGCFLVPGKPHGKERPRFNSKTKKAYPTQAQIEAEGDVRRAYYQAGYERLEFDALIRVDIVCCYALPEGMSEEERQAWTGKPAYTGSPVEKRRKKWERDNLDPDDKRYGPIPDGDNCLKTILDGLQGQPRKRAYVAIMDDRQVIEASVRSVYGPKDCTQVRITVLAPKEQTGGDAE